MIKMRDMTRIILAHKLPEQQLSITKIGNTLGVSRCIVFRLAQGIEEHEDLDNFLKVHR
jgi:hypothetical protein